MRNRGRLRCGGAAGALRLCLVAAVALAVPGGLSGAQGAAGTGEPPDGYRVRAAVESEPVGVGEIFALAVEISHPPGHEVAPLLDQAVGDFRIVGLEAVGSPDSEDDSGDGSPRVAPADPSEPDATESVTRFRVRLGAFVLPGDREIPALSFGARGPDGELHAFETDPVPIRIVSSLPADETAEADALHDIRGPFLFDLPPRYQVLALLLAGVLAAAALAYWFLRRRSRRPEPEIPLPAPAEEAEAALARLQRSGLLESGEVVAFYDALADIVKRYAGRRFGVPWSERTTAEMMADLRGRLTGDLAATGPLLLGILDEADLAKFSERRFRPDRASARFTEAGVFLDRTRPSVRAPDPEPEAGSEAAPESDAGNEGAAGGGKGGG